MFCNQCEQAAKGEGCTKIGVCGKEPGLADLQDLLIYVLQGLSQVSVEGRRVGVTDSEVNLFVCEATFSTLTNVNFDTERFIQLIKKGVALRESLKVRVKQAGGSIDFPDSPAEFVPADDFSGLVKQGEAVELNKHPDEDPDILSLKQILLYGLKGVAAYADHAKILGREDEAVYAFIQEALAAMLRTDMSVDEWIGMVLKCGEGNLRAMELLDDGNTSTYGHPRCHWELKKARPYWFPGMI